jgi:hypothetical protein
MLEPSANDGGHWSKKVICGQGVEASIVRQAGIDWINEHRIMPPGPEEVLRW